MLCRRFRQIFSVKSQINHKSIHRFDVRSQFHVYKRCHWIKNVFTFIGSTECGSMSSVHKFRHILRDLSVARLWGAWTKSYYVSSVIRKCRRERVVRDMVQCFRQTLLRPKHTLLLSATAAYRKADDEVPPGCDKSITDQELEALSSELDNVEELSRNTLYCAHCDKRLVVDRKHPGVTYCGCKDTQPSEDAHEGWVPFMEAEDVVIWRKEYKKGQGVYAYKVYGRYNEVRAEDFAAIQVDGEYRKEWDTAVASLSVVEKGANGIRDQAVLHWEVLWPKLFANRDYVYIRRHKHFSVKTTCHAHKDGLFGQPVRPCTETAERLTEAEFTETSERRNTETANREKTETKAVRPRAKRKPHARERDNRVYIILSRSCEHASAPETKRAIRVTEYWSHMVVRTLEGTDKPGMEFVLTYYDEPSTGTLPTGVTAWATGRAAPNYLDRMRRAADHYQAWMRSQNQQPDVSFSSSELINTPETKEPIIVEQEMQQPTKVEEEAKVEVVYQVKHESTQTEVPPTEPSSNGSRVQKSLIKKDNFKEKEYEECDSDDDNGRSWWQYLYPFYYFV